MHYSSLDDDNNSDLVLKKLSNIIDKDMLSPFFPGNKSIKFGTLQKVFGKKTDIKKITIERDWNTKKETVKRQDLESWEQFGYHNNKIYIKGIDTQFDWRKDSYVIKQLAVGDTLYVVTETDGTDVERVAAIGNISDDKERDRQMKFYQKIKNVFKMLWLRLELQKVFRTMKILR